MEKTIWKYSLEIRGTQTLEIPEGAEILTVQVQDGIAFLWVLVDPDEQKEKRYFEVFETGELIIYEMGLGRNYIGTFQLFSGNLVCHVFEKGV
ncbi:MAG: hypothetical protein IID16_00845 [Candidatus Marinimicrobia bacterium]|nr:hypothetical protein [Candidatus Neomarinimicrobiota bacterium]